MGTRVNGVDLDAGTSGPTLSDATPAALGVAAAGVSTDASRADHVHALPTIPAVSSATPQPIGTATAGVSADAARADHVHGLTSALISAPSTGWTAAGDGIASITAGEVTLTIAAAQNTALLAFPVDISSPFHPAIEVSARVTRTTTPGGGPLQRLGIGVGNALRTDVAATARGLLNEVDPAATVSFIANSAGSWGSLGTAALPATVDSGNLWLRVVYSAGGVSAFVGSGATRPTSWTLIAAAAPQHAISGVGAATHVQVYAYRNLGTGNMVVRVDQIQWRSLLGAPT